MVFALPVSGASGEFIEQVQDFPVVTGPDGLVVARGLRTNDVAGKLSDLRDRLLPRTAFLRTLINLFVEAAPGTTTQTPDLQTSKSGASGNGLSWA